MPSYWWGDIYVPVGWSMMIDTGTEVVLVIYGVGAVEVMSHAECERRTLASIDADLLAEHGIEGRGEM